MTIQELKQAYGVLYNWSEETFQEAFRHSPIGWDYHWLKFLEYHQHGKVESGRAMLRTLGGMDDVHFDMLRAYIEKKTYQAELEFEAYITRRD